MWTEEAARVGRQPERGTITDINSGHFDISDRIAVQKGVRPVDMQLIFR